MSKELDKLIEQVLSEKDLFKYDVSAKKRGKYPANTPKIRAYDIRQGAPEPATNEKEARRMGNALDAMDKNKDQIITDKELISYYNSRGGTIQKTLKPLLLWAIYKLKDQMMVQAYEDATNAEPIVSRGITKKGAFKAQVAPDKDGRQPAYTPKWVTAMSKALRSLLANQETEKFEITNVDFEKALDDPTSKIHFEVVGLLDSLLAMAQEGDNFDDAVNQVIINVVPKLLGSVKREDPGNIKLGGGDRALPNIPITSRYRSAYGRQTPALLQQIFTQAGVTGTSLQQKLTQINNIAENIQSATAANNIEEGLSGAIVVDYMRRIIQDYEASAGGFLFENFLAMIMGGTKEGGNIKIEDFTWDEDREGGQTRKTYGSAKLYKAGAKEYSGSRKLFGRLAKRGVDQIVYVLAHKNDDLNKIEVYIDALMFTKRDDDYVISKADGTEGELVTIKGAAGAGDDDDLENQIYFTWPQVGATTINLGLESEKQAEQDTAVKTFLNSTSAFTGDMMSALNSFTVNTTDTFTKPKKNPDEKLKSYVSTLESFRDLRKLVFKAFSGLGGGSYEKGASRRRKADYQALGKIGSVTESTSLDQLIEAVMKGMLNETK
jgi:hypothetical protein